MALWGVQLCSVSINLQKGLSILRIYRRKYSNKEGKISVKGKLYLIGIKNTYIGYVSDPMVIGFIVDFGTYLNKVEIGVWNHGIFTLHCYDKLLYYTIKFGQFWTKMADVSLYYEPYNVAI